jgi:hypothetical protein
VTERRAVLCNRTVETLGMAALAQGIAHAASLHDNPRTGSIAVAFSNFRK